MTKNPRKIKTETDREAVISEQKYTKTEKYSGQQHQDMISS